MPLEIGLWRVDDAPTRVLPTSMPMESRLEGLIEADPTILGEPLLLLGRQIPTTYGKYIDLLGMDMDGALQILELKRDRTPREVVAQLLDYGSWAQSLGNEDVRRIFADYRTDVEFDQAFAELFGGSPPSELNTAHKLTVIASEIDTATERIVTYLNGGYGVPVNVLFFRYFADEGHSYLARTWLIDDSRAAASAVGQRQKSSKEPWNGRDWYVSFGDEAGIRSWDDARQYGFVSAGGGEWFSRTLRSLPVGARMFVYIPKTGYVGVGTVAGEAQPFSEAVLTVDGQPQKMSELTLQAKYVHDHQPADQDRAEYVVPVAWTDTIPQSKAVWKTGMFANQNSACKLSNRFTIDELVRAFRLEE